VPYGEHVGELDGNLEGTSWEHIGNQGKNEKKILPNSPNLKGKKRKAP